ncbi:hypothetical protein XFF6990_400042 [Xanthomonas citri pv. fuscans]|uniref:Uncharacterized protein n=1 Tax=Xanthomonas campestris pv. phaseoli TaxID=317013 RepID=A0A7Z7IX99_XANCH|nr:hypothetical protein XFF6990_400042 [Xanthomonas citri pv. fuscans]SOO23302.1 hypothetical protein XFF6991_260008 [Xanthomonas phaseoli pv. phaseoli]
MISAVRIGLAATQPPYYRGLERLTKRREQLSGGADGALRTGVYEWYMRFRAPAAPAWRLRSGFVSRS